MKFGDLNKQQKQYLFLGVLAAVFALYCVVNFGVSPLWAAWKAARADYDDLSAKLEDADRLMDSQGTLRQNLEVSRQVMRDAMQEYVPDPENPLSWATQKIYYQAREVGIDIQSVSETGASMVLQAQGESRSRAFGSYAVRIVFDSAYEDVKVLVASLETSNPYLCVSGITITAKPGSPEVHMVNLTVEWPIWTDAGQADELWAKEEGNEV